MIPCVQSCSCNSGWCCLLSTIKVGDVEQRARLRNTPHGEYSEYCMYTDSHVSIPPAPHNWVLTWRAVYTCTCVRLFRKFIGVGATYLDSRAQNKLLKVPGSNKISKTHTRVPSLIHGVYCNEVTVSKLQHECFRFTCNLLASWEILARMSSCLCKMHALFTNDVE